MIAKALKIPFSELINLPSPKNNKNSEMEITILINSIRSLEERKRLVLLATIKGLIVKCHDIVDKIMCQDIVDNVL